MPSFGFIIYLAFLISVFHSCGKNVVVFPSRAVAIENALRLFSPRLAIVDEHLTRHLPRQWLTSLALGVRIMSAVCMGFHFLLFIELALL